MPARRGPQAKYSPGTKKAWRIKAYKRSIESGLLGREAHADVFEPGSPPAFLFVLFGGSGVDEEEYARRSRTVIPIFDEVLKRLTDLNATFVHVTAPYDVPLNRFAANPAAAATWNAHVRDELLSPWSGLPWYLCSFSGGAALALNGLHQEPCCFGAAALGADAIPRDFVSPAHWQEKLRVYAAPADRVCHHPANRQIIESLAARGELEEFPLTSGSHRLADYATAECLSALFRFARSLVPA